MSDHPDSPWRTLFEQVRTATHNRRDADGVVGSINWLRKHMAQRGANPNVVRNIIYRDKGKLADKRTLYEILQALWQAYGNEPLHTPELTALFAAAGGAEQEVAQLLGREKRRVYSAFVGAIQAGEHPKLLVTGRPGSGKTLLFDYVQQALELPPKTVQVVRLEAGADLAAFLTRLGLALSLPRDLLEAKLVKVAAQSAFAVQADAQAEVARTLIEAARVGGTRVLLIHLSQALSEPGSLGGAALRLNTPDVPRVSMSEWLWLSLLEPLSQLPDLSLLVSMVQAPFLALQHLGAFAGPFKLNPPTAAEARRFVRARLPNLNSQQQDQIVARAGRSFEELRTLTLLAALREPLPGEGDSEHLTQLSALLDTAGDPRLRDFLRAVSVLALPELATFSETALLALRDPTFRSLTPLEIAFLDPVPGEAQGYRLFSRQFARLLRARFETHAPEAYRALNRRAADVYETAAQAAPVSDEAARYLSHLLAARDWAALEMWISSRTLPQPLLRRMWATAEAELGTGKRFEAVAQQVANHYVRLGSYSHPDALRAFAALAESARPELRLWTVLKQAEGAVLKGHTDEAERLLAGLPPGDPEGVLGLERALIEASVARWHSDLKRATDLVNGTARPLLTNVSERDTSGRLAHAKVAVWAGLIRKDQGDLEGALAEFASLAAGDDLIEARVAFQQGDVLIKLGRFDAALCALDKAVDRARRSEALAQEQTRYLARRGSLHRLRGDLVRASADFEAALAGLQEVGGEALEHEFWRAKITDERALYLLATGNFDEAIFALEHDQEVFTRYETAYRVDAGYRRLRGQLHLSLAYTCRALAQPYRLPLDCTPEAAPQARDLDHARALYSEVVAGIAARALAGGYSALERQSLLVGSLLAETPERALERAEAATKLAAVTYQEAEAYTYLASARLRAGDLAGVGAALARARGALAVSSCDAPEERGDLGLSVWQACLDFRARLAVGDVAGALENLLARLFDPDLQAYAGDLLRTFGEALEMAPLETRNHPALRRTFGTTLESGRLRLPDALVRHGLPQLVATAEVA